MEKTPDGGNESVEWTRSDTIALSYARCTDCEGVGLRRVRRGGGVTACGCVRRAMCRAVVQRLHEISHEQGGKASNVVAQRSQVRTFTYSRPVEEFVADAYLIARRALSAAEWDCFRFAMLLGADWRAMTKRLGMDRGNYYHLYYRTEEKLGLAWATVKPYPVYPIRQYFEGNRKGDAETARTGN